MTEKIIKILSEYTKIPVEQLHSGTMIGRSAVSNSIILHRMYAAIAKEGINITDYQEIKTVGDLESRISGVEMSVDVIPAAKIGSQLTGTPGQERIGIDLEETSKMPRVNDFREDAFYAMNFTQQEIAYCILQPDPYASFTGLFAAKEAIIKADNSYKQTAFNKIFIDHLPGGQPVFNGFSLSISHVGDFSVAVAIMNLDLPNMNGPGQNDTVVKNNRNFSVLVSIIAILLALIAIGISLFKNN